MCVNDVVWGTGAGQLFSAIWVPVLASNRGRLSAFGVDCWNCIPAPVPGTDTERDVKSTLGTIFVPL